MIDQTTVVSDIHKKVMNNLENYGVELMEEVDFPPYRADIYVPAAHAIVEVDGPQHKDRRDQLRDANLSNLYFLHVIRVKTDKIRKDGKWITEILDALDEAMKTGIERWDKCKMKTPWL